MLRTLVVGGLLGVVGMATAQEMPAKLEFAKRIAPLLDEQTMVVVRVDVARAPVDGITKLLSSFTGEADISALAPTLRAWAKEFKSKGGREVFFTYGPNDFPNKPVLFAPIGATPPERKDLGALLKTLLGDDETLVIDHLHGCVVAGPKVAVDDIKTRKAAPRPDLQEALSVGKDAIAQLAFGLTKDARKIHEQIVPFLPDDLGGGDIKTITRGLQWLALIVGAGEKIPVQWILEATDNDALQKLQRLHAKATETTGKILADVGDPDIRVAKRKQWETLTKSITTVAEGKRLTATVELGPVLTSIAENPDTRLTADRARSFNNLKQLMIALHNYHETYGTFPHDIRSKDNKPLLSWRVAILPYIDQTDLYRRFKLDEPWDSEHNKKLIPLLPKVLRSPRQAAVLAERTTYLAPLGPGFMWDEPKGLKFVDILDGSSNTIALVEVDDEHGVIWTKPEDFRVDAKDPTKGLLGHYGTGFAFAMADGSAHFFPKSMPALELWAFFTRAGGEVAKFPK